MSKKMYFVLAIIFSILSFCGAFYVLYNAGNASPGFAVIPGIFSLACAGGYRKGKDNKEYTKNSKYLNLGIGIGLPIGIASGVSHAIMSNSDMELCIALGAIIGTLIWIIISSIIKYQIYKRKWYNGCNKATLWKCEIIYIIHKGNATVQWRCLFFCFNNIHYWL